MTNSQLTLNADIIREHNDLSRDSSLTIDISPQNKVMLGIEGVWGHTSAQLHPAEARKVANVLRQAANQAESCCSESTEIPDGN